MKRPTIDEAIDMFERGCLTREEVVNFYENHLDQELDFSYTKILDNVVIEVNENMNPNIQLLKMRWIRKRLIVRMKTRVD